MDARHRFADRAALFVPAQRVDRCAMRFEIEMREPFLDRAIVSYARRLDRSALIDVKDSTGKVALRDLYDRYPDRAAAGDLRPKKAAL
jgi:asparagine synthase (glutamine-hydrolysing)